MNNIYYQNPAPKVSVFIELVIGDVFMSGTQFDKDFDVLMVVESDSEESGDMVIRLIDGEIMSPFSPDSPVIKLNSTLKVTPYMEETEAW